MVTQSKVKTNLSSRGGVLSKSSFFGSSSTLPPKPKGKFSVTMDDKTNLLLTMPIDVNMKNNGKIYLTMPHPDAIVKFIEDRLNG
jgi:hypothetical protein